MSQIQPDLFSHAQTTDRRHRNHFLFSDYYLNELLFGSKAWNAEIEAGIAFLEALQGLYSAEKTHLTTTYSENQNETHWIQPILDLLGWEGAYETQAIIPALQSKRIRKPDYVFFPNRALRQAANARQNTPTYAQDAVLVGDAKKWGIALNKKQKGKPTFDNNNPSHQIDYYLRATDVRWGLLTDGRYWRLVNKESSYKLDVYFEIDLLDIIDNKSKNGALYFWLFFRRDAYVPDAHGKIFVAEALTASLNYAREVENDLRDNAYKALEQLIQGFFAFERNQLNSENPDHLQAVYTNSLYLLYRLLFLLYGESRGLLALTNRKYFEVSLTNLVNEVAGKLDNDNHEFSPFSFQYWARQQHLCEIINGTSAAANAYYSIPRYNGGLFNPTEHAFLEQHKMGDAYLLRAIDYLARRDRHKQGEHAVKERVDYRTLGVRQLGSIYEGLLEYRPARATEPLATIRHQGNEVWIPASKLGRKTALETRAVGDLYLATDKGERKATGSYYTPDYIVRYIVEQTLQPLIDQNREAVSALPEAEQGSAFAERILALNVLDPAMGSGHFLVAAAEYLALALTNADFVVPPALPAESSLSALERQAQEKNYWLRRVTEACIYGVDKNKMAVELAKLSLWLTTVSAEKPLSFLDHHLRHGDSLVGARLSDLVTLPVGKSGRQAVRSSEGQQMLIDEGKLTTDINLAVGGMMAIEHATSDSLEDIHTKETLYKQLRDHVAKWHTLANVWVSSYFGNAMAPEEYADIARHLQGKPTVANVAQLQPYLDHPTISDNDYFHWELEFPEVFFDQYGRPLKEDGGFDAVIGNPPYVRQEALSLSKSFLEGQFNTFHGLADLYTYFMELGVNFLKQAGLCSFIVSHKFMRANYGLKLRRLITRQTKLEQIIHFGDLPIFPEATAYPAILQWRKHSQDDAPLEVHVAQFTEMNFTDDLQLAVQQAGYFVSQIGLQDSGWTLRNGQITHLQRKIRTVSLPLSDYVSHKIHYGIKTGLNQAFYIDHQTYQKIIDTTTQAKTLIKSLVVGEDVRRYRVNQAKRYVIIIPAGWTVASSGLSNEDEAWQWLQMVYPALATHLAPFAKRAKQRHDQGDFWWELRPCAYYDAFDAPKLIYPVIAKTLRFSLDYDGLYGNDKTFIIPKEDKYLLAVLNSSLTAFFGRYALSGLRGDYLEFRASHLQKLPIYAVSFTTPQLERWTSVANAISHYEQMDRDAILRWATEEVRMERDDTFHDLLSFLVEQMIAMKKQQATAKEQFWLDLEGVAEEKLYKKLTGKGKWEQSVYTNVETARPFVQADSRRRVMLDASLGWNEAAFKGFVKLLAGKVHGLSDLLDVYRTYHADYRALSDKIAATDALIDQLVYQLYGLTDEEIALVEAAT